MRIRRNLLDTGKTCGLGITLNLGCQVDVFSFGLHLRCENSKTFISFKNTQYKKKNIKAKTTQDVIK